MEQNVLPFRMPSMRLAIRLFELLERRPKPLRRFDQIPMKVTDLSRHALWLYKNIERHGKRLALIGDSDGLAAALLCIAEQRGDRDLVITVLDFDERVLAFYKEIASQLGISTQLFVRRYNVFSSFPPDLLSQFDWFHTSPPFGRYNSGRSIVAFVERGFCCLKQGGGGVIIIGHDKRSAWTREILAHTLSYLLRSNACPSTVVGNLHGYELDDEPSLKSGVVLCDEISPRPRHRWNLPLPKQYLHRFYGRNDLDIPAFIPITYIESEPELPLESLPPLELKRGRNLQARRQPAGGHPQPELF